MRPKLGLILTAAAAFAALSAHADPPTAALTPIQRALLNDVFVAAPAGARRQDAPFATTTLAVRQDARTAASAGGDFAMPAITGAGFDQTRLLNPERLVNGQGLVVWRSKEVSFPRPDGAVDTLRMTLGGVARAPGGVVVAAPGSLLAPDAEAFDVTYTRGWPAAWSASDGRLAFSVSPHAGLGLNNAGPSAEAGAEVRVARNLEHDVMNRLGVREVDSKTFANQGHWYLFAAASGRAVGLTMAPGDQSYPSQRIGWSDQTTAAVVSDAQAGIGWRKGDIQASVGYVHRDVRNETAITTGYTPQDFHDSMVAFSFSLAR